jgi:AAA+ superfamily predicted ATPase
MKEEILPSHVLLDELDEVKLASLPVYEDPMDHVRDELRRLALLIDLRGMIMKEQGRVDDGNRFRGLLLREGELDDLIRRAVDGSEEITPDTDVITRKREEFAVMTRRITLREAATLWAQREGAGGCRLPLLEICQCFHLDRFSYHVLVLALAPEVDLGFQRMFSYLLNDVTRKRPTVHLALELLSADDSSRRSGRRAFAQDAPAILYNLVHLEPTRTGMETSLLLREFKMPERVVQWLLGTVELAPAMRRYSQLSESVATFDDLVFDERGGVRVTALGEYLRRLGRGGSRPTPLVVLSGVEGVGKRTVAGRLAACVDMPLLVVNLPSTAIPLAERDVAFRDMAREARLHGASICLAGYTSEQEKSGTIPALTYLYGIVRLAPGIGAVTGPGDDMGLAGAGTGFATRVRLEVPEAFGRLVLWKRLIELSGVPIGDGVDLRGFSLKYGFSAGALARVLTHANEEAAVRSGDPDAAIEAEDLDMASRIQLGQGLSGIATRVRRTARWEDVILPDEIVETLQEIIRHARYRNEVFHDWGFDRKMTSGKGLSALFSGPPGTGKTMVAGVIAADLGMDLYRVDLSQVVSKYVGETEKNLSKVFQSAAGNQFIILFDEADSLFAKRTEVKSSVDRYANLEVNYLLQKMEEYTGICILTTNFEKSIDEAFKRRLNFRIDFPFPEPKDRVLLWRAHFPIEAPVEGDLELDWIAEKYELSGGNIKNAVLRAAFRAVGNDRAINIDDLEYAAEREARELGKLVQGAGY